MRVALAGLCLLLASPALAQTAADETAVRKLVGQYAAPPQPTNAEPVGAMFTEDADQVTIYGDWRRGRAAIVPGLLRAWQNQTGKRSLTIENVRFLNPDTAIADGPYVVTPPNGPPQRNWMAVVVSRTPAGWRIAGIRTALPATRP